MTPQLLTVKIQAVLGGRSEASEMQKRAVALEYYKLCADAETQLEHCVALIRAGREYPALQVAESSDLLDRLNALVFPELGQWRDFCAAHNLPVPPPFDDEQISLVNSLYSKGVSQNHPLYRDYRRAMRLRRYPEALAVIKTISKINAYDAEARREYDRLRKRVADGRLALLERALRREDAEAVSKLCGELEADAELLADNPVWLEAAKFNRNRQAELERARRAEIIGELEKIDIDRDLAKASDLVNELNLDRNTADFDAAELAFVEKISDEIAERQNAVIAAEKAARACNLLRIELEKPRASESAKRRLAKLEALAAEAADAPDPETEKRLRAELSALRRKLALSRTLKTLATLAAVSAIGTGSFYAWQFARDSEAARSAENALVEMEVSNNPKSLFGKIDEFERKYPQLAKSKFASRLALVKENATVAKKRSERIGRILSKISATDFATAKSKAFDTAKTELQSLYTDLPSLPPAEQADARDKIDELSSKIADAIDARKIANAKAVKTGLAKYEKIAEEYENFARSKADIDRDADAVLKVLRPLMEDVSPTFRAHKLDIEKFGEISVKASEAKNRYDRFDKLRESLAASRTPSEYLAALEMLVESGATPANYARKLSKIAETAKAIKLGQVAELGTQTGFDRIDSAGIAPRDSLPPNRLLTNLYKYTREDGYGVYTVGKLNEKTRKWSGGSETVQEVDEIGAGGRIASKIYRKNFVNGRPPRGSLLGGETEPAESQLGREAYAKAAEKSLLEALNTIAKAKANPIFKAYLEGAIFSKLAAHPVETLLEYSPLAKKRMEKVERYSKPLNDYSWIFESNSRAKLMDAELYSEPAPDYLGDAQTHVKALKIAAKNPLLLVGICDENGAESVFKEPKGAIWSVDAATGRFGKIGETIADCAGKLAPLAPIFCETKSTREILAEAAL